MRLEIRTEAWRLLVPLRIENQTLTITTKKRELALELETVLRARLYDLSVLRDIQVTEFAPRLVQPLADGIRLQLVNEAHGLFIPVEFRAEADGPALSNVEGFRVTVKAGWICEQMSINRRLMTLDVLPELMATHVGDEGLYLLPDFCGTLVRFKEHVPTVTRDRLYMTQAEWEKLSVMNCFGLKQGKQGTLAIVHQGDFCCHAVTEVNQEGVNRIYASFGVRHRPGEPIKQEDKEVIVRFTEGRENGYVDLAKAYRDSLVNERGVSPLKPRLADNPTLAYSVGAMRTKIFHGMKPSSLDGNVPIKVNATFAQAEAILDSMKAAGIDKAIVTLVGWNLGGHDGAYPQKFPIEPALGGEEGLRKLISKAKGMGYQIVPHDNNTDMYMAGQTYDPEVVLRHEDNTPVLGGIWGGGQAAKACPVAYFDRYGPDVTRIRDLGFEGHYYCDAQSNPLYCCHDPRHPADEEQFGFSQCKLTQAYRTLYGAVSQEMAPAYALPFIDEGGVCSPHHVAWPMPYVDETLTRIIDRVVPFYQLAVHGLILYQQQWIHGHRHAGVRRGMLRDLAFGARPAMEVSYNGGGNGDLYTDSIRDVIEGYRIAYEELADTHVELVEDYEELAPEASRIVYANGTALTVNWGDTPVGDLAPLSYRIEREARG
ncbi:MAG: DUF5696 domain-containing protein [Planctomycetota bacterium]|nr:DUF5696 domain-containing protein [Planctomycetota bacterium]